MNLVAFSVITTSTAAPSLTRDDAKAADYARRHSGHVSEDMGYHIGSTVTGSTRGGMVTLTYVGNDVWSGSDGYNWYAYLGVDNRIHWDSGVRS